MIENEIQYEITKKWVEKFTHALEQNEIVSNLITSDLYINIERDALYSQLVDLQTELEDYKCRVEQIKHI